MLEKDILFAGDVDLCSRVWKWWRQCRIGAGKAGYWDILEESEPEIRKLQIPSIERAEAEAYDMVMLVAPEYDSISGMPKDGTRRKYDTYIKKLKECGICDYTDYFSYASKLAGLEIKEEMEIRKELRPLGIVIGAIPWHSGNILMKLFYNAGVICEWLHLAAEAEERSRKGVPLWRTTRTYQKMYMTDYGRRKKCCR